MQVRETFTRDGGGQSEWVRSHPSPRPIEERPSQCDAASDRSAAFSFSVTRASIMLQRSMKMPKPKARRPATAGPGPEDESVDVPVVQASSKLSPQVEPAAQHATSTPPLLLHSPVVATNSHDDTCSGQVNFGLTLVESPPEVLV